MTMNPFRATVALLFFGIFAPASRGQMAIVT